MITKQNAIIGIITNFVFCVFYKCFITDQSIVIVHFLKSKGIFLNNTSGLLSALYSTLYAVLFKTFS